MTFGFKDKYTETDLQSALVYHVNTEAFAPITFWIDQLREKVIIEQRQASVVGNPTLMAVESGRLSMIDEVRRTILAKRNTIFDVPQSIVVPVKVKKPRQSKSNIDAKTGLSIGALKYAKENKISIPSQGVNLAVE